MIRTLAIMKRNVVLWLANEPKTDGTNLLQVDQRSAVPNLVRESAETDLYYNVPNKLKWLKVPRFLED